MAINGSRSKFTSANNYNLDTFREMLELSATEVADVNRWKTLKAKNRTSEEQSEFTTLSNKLACKMITAEDWNLLLDAMYNLEQAYKNKGLNQIEVHITDYISNYVEQNSKDAISDVINTTIEDSYDIGAVKIIISETTPNTFTEGALWIKPKATT
jgi:hypothetical protein